MKTCVMQWSISMDITHIDMCFTFDQLKQFIFHLQGKMKNKTYLLRNVEMIMTDC